MALQLDLFQIAPPAAPAATVAEGEGAGAGGRTAAAGNDAAATRGADIGPGAAGTAAAAGRSGLVVCHGPLAAEAWLLARLDALAAEARREPARLALPVRVVVPSRSLRRHLAAQLVRPRSTRVATAPALSVASAASAGAGAGPPRAVRPAVAGVVVQTLFGLACEILERAGMRTPRGALLFETLVERAARGDDALRGGLGDLVDGYLAAAPAVADLLDAGLEPEHAEALDEALASDGPRAAGSAAVERARALVRVAARTEARLRKLGLGRRSTLLRQAAEALRALPPERVLPARAILLHGFVAASGVAADLLAALLRQFGATLLLDQPPVPGREPDGEREGEPGIEATATLRLAERAAAAAALAPGAAAQAAPAVLAAGVPAIEREGAALQPAAPPRARLEAFTAAGAEAEAREVARRLRRLLDGGEFPPTAPGAPNEPATDHLGALERSAAEGFDSGALEAAVAGWARTEGPSPEGYAVVARDLDPYRLALRRHLRRLGVPFSGVGERGGLLPAGRRAWAALDLLRLGAEAPADRWLDACEWMPAELRVDLRLALRSLGAARLRDVAALREQTFAAGVALPVRQGLMPAAASPPRGLAPAAGSPAVAGAAEAAEPAPGDARGADGANGADGAKDADAAEGAGDDGEGREVARSRRISWRKLRQGVLAAGRVHDRLQAWPPEAAASVQLEWLGGLLDELGLDAGPEQPLAAAAAELRRELPGALALGSEELRLLLARALGEGGRCPLGGDGGGVQVLSVAEARGRTFDHLFLLGLNRGVFPRPRREDPLLPDDLRQVLRGLLPDLPLARDSFDDERHAFAQLLAAAPAVTLSWLIADDDGKPLSPSPLVERLLRGPVLAPLLAPALYPSRLVAGDPAAGSHDRDGPRPADEHAVLAGLHGPRHRLGQVLPLAVSQVWDELGPPSLALDPAAVAAARLRVLDELDPDLRTPAGRAAAARLGPYFGFSGQAPSRGGHQLYVTHLEKLAACPWQYFLGRLLRIERPPDPLRALPGADPLRLGNVVHRALERIVKQARAAAPAAAREEAVAAAAATVAVRWPAADELEPLLATVTAEVLAEEGLVLPGLAQALATHALPFVAAAGSLDWPDAGAAVPVLAGEAEGELLLDLAAAAEPGRAGLGTAAAAAAAGGSARRLRFRADRVDLVDGRRRYTDYKTGRHLSDARDAGKRRAQLLAEIRAGKRLQAAAYVLAGGARALGRYLFLRPDLAPELQEVAVEAGDREAAAAFAAAAQAVLAAWDAGAFFPRLVDPMGRKEPSRCALCAVAEACLRGDSGARRRLATWAERGRAGAAPAHPAEAAMLAAWELPAAGGRGWEGEREDAGEIR
ncbi:MAG: PD-(D/E)XK nuclease family protein [Acidobacteria bacterium]|nr:PD-(D/E)XK nuclease family protein [Acidobacteriota bacterium]